MYKTPTGEWRIRYTKDDKDPISLKLRNIPLHSQAKKFSGATVVSTYMKPLGKEATEAIHDFKFGHMDEYEANYLVKRSAIYLWLKYFEDKDIDVVLVPKSKRPLAKQFAEYFIERIPYKIDYYIDAFSKSAPEEVKIYADRLKDKKEKTLKTIKRDLEKMGSEFEMKRMFGRYRKLLYGFLELDEKLKDKVSGKNVLIVDDYLTSGMTFSEMIRLINQYNPSNVYGATIMKGL